MPITSSLRHMPALAPAVVLLIAAGAACSSKKRESAVRDEVVQSHDAVAAGPDVITAREIAAARTAANAYELIVQIRPQLLKPRGVQSMTSMVTGTPTVFLDRARLGDIETLKTITLAGIAEIRYFNPQNASSRFGLDERSGVILITSKR